MSTTIIYYSQKEIKEMIRLEIEKLRKEFYIDLNKLRNQIVDLRDIASTLNRGLK